MREIASVILSGYQTKFEQKLSGNAMFSICERIGVRDFYTCASAEVMGHFDLILFSHAFKSYSDTGEWTEEKANIKEIALTKLAPKGKLMFLTPQDPDKLRQKREIAENLSNAGMIHIPITMSGTISAPVKRPTVLTDIRKRFIHEGDRLGVSHVFPDPDVCRDDQPYYHCNCDVDVFIKPFPVPE